MYHTWSSFWFGTGHCQINNKTYKSKLNKIKATLSQIQQSIVSVHLPIVLRDFCAKVPFRRSQLHNVIHWQTWICSEKDATKFKCQLVQQMYRKCFCLLHQFVLKHKSPVYCHFLFTRFCFQTWRSSNQMSWSLSEGMQRTPYCECIWGDDALLSDVSTAPPEARADFICCRSGLLFQ